MKTKQITLDLALEKVINDTLFALEQVKFNVTYSYGREAVIKADLDDCHPPEDDELEYELVDCLVFEVSKNGDDTEVRNSVLAKEIALQRLLLL